MTDAMNIHNEGILRLSETGREPDVGIDRCSLCARDNVEVFTFLDNEAYSHERICETCLRSAVKLIEECGAGTKVTRRKG